jgi:mRNA interferase HicA
MKRQKLVKYLQENGCELYREGKKHSWWFNKSLNKRSAIPRHTEISDILANKICIDLGVKPIRKKTKGKSKKVKVSSIK